MPPIGLPLEAGIGTTSSSARRSRPARFHQISRTALLNTVLTTSSATFSAPKERRTESEANVTLKGNAQAPPGPSSNEVVMLRHLQ